MAKKTKKSAGGSGGKRGGGGSSKKAPTGKRMGRKARARSTTDRYGLSTGSAFQPRAVPPVSAGPNFLDQFQPAATPTPEILTTQLSAASGQSFSELGELKLDVPDGIEPRLQLAIANFRSGKLGPTLSSTANDEVAVVARVASVEEWEAIPDVDPGIVLGPTEDGKSWIVTGRFPLDRLEAVSSNEHVLSLSAPQVVQPTLETTVEALEAMPLMLPKGVSPRGGKGVVVGIVDFGCDFVHENFRRRKKTRLLAIWDQKAPNRHTPLYGTVHTRREINAALATPDPYAALGYNPGYEEGGAHGTHVMDIAAGSGGDGRAAGVAPEADIVFVDASISDIGETGEQAVNTHFGDSIQLLEAVQFVFDVAGDRPCVCNLSLGTNGGPHDATSLVEQGLDTIVRQRPNRAIVIAAGNGQDKRIHKSGKVLPGEVHRIDWEHRLEGGGELEIWYPGDEKLEVTFFAPDGTEVGTVAPGGHLPYGSRNDEVLIFIGSRLDDPNNGDNMIGIWVANKLASGRFVVELRSQSDEVEYHAWIEPHVSKEKQSRFVEPVNSHTLASISNGRHTIVVGNYDAHKRKKTIAPASSRGPTRDGRSKPEVSAPGQHVHAALSGSLNAITKKSGTSMAAPAVTGLIALIYAEAKRKGKTLSIARLRKKLIDGVATDPPDLAKKGDWDAAYGFGRANSRSVKL